MLAVNVIGNVKPVRVCGIRSTQELTRGECLMRKLFVASLTLLFLTLSNSAVGYSRSIPGQTYSIGNGFTGGTHPEGSHFHSSNLDELPVGNPSIIFPGAAEVGGFFGDEEIRGISEFSLDEAAYYKAILLFDVLDTFAEGLSLEPSGIDGLFGQGPLDGVVDVFAFVADGVESFSDYQTEPISPAPILSIDVGAVSYTHLTLPTKA